MSDLTRWNRAGLERFRYVDGNAMTCLELLRQALHERFPEWKRMQGVAKETPDQAAERVARQFREGRGDWGWEIARAFSRACHVLTEHIDAYANEAYLGTATQWDSVRKLVEMLGYRPHPPASAVAALILLAKQGRSGKVAKGHAVKFSPPDGGAPVVYETLADIEVDHRLNALRPRDFDRAQRTVNAQSRLKLDRLVEGVRLGEPVIIEDESRGFLVARLISQVEIEDDASVLHVAPALPASPVLRAGDLALHLLPADVLTVSGEAMPGASAQMLGRSLYLEEPPAGLQAGDVIHITDNQNHYFRQVLGVQGHRVALSQAPGNLQLRDATVSRARQVSVTTVPGRKAVNLFVVRITGDLGNLSGKQVAHFIGQSGPRPLADYPVVTAKYVPVDATSGAAAADKGYTTVTLDDSAQPLVNPQNLFIPSAAREWKVDSFLRNDVEQPFSATIVTAAPKKLVTGDLAAVVSGGNLAWGRLASVALDRQQNTGNVAAERWHSLGGGRYYLSQTRLYGHFKERARLHSWNRNETPLTGTEIALAKPKDGPALEERALVPGRDLLLEIEGGARMLSARVKRYDAGNALLTIEPALALADGFKCGTTLVRANVVLAGHGEARPDKLLGSGDATRSNQAFVFKVPGVAFVADPSQPSGVRADIDVRVDGQAWTQVPTLQESGAAALHYSVRMTEEGYLLIEFGDGTNGRRLPSGENNVRITHRLGSGLAGNLPPGSLTKAVHPHPLVESVRQPLASSGGNDMESTASLRRAAPATVLALERAVVLEDYAYFAASHSSVWQARALPRPTRHRRRAAVEVVVIPAGGAPLGPLARTLEEFLTARGAPAIEVQVTDFQRAVLRLQVTVGVIGAQFDPDAVKRRVRTALVDAYALRRRGIGQPVYLSEVYSVVEAVQGVENSRCAFLDEGGHALAEQVRHVSARTVLYIDPAVAEPIIESREFEL